MCARSYGIHSFYDVLGLYLVWQRGLAPDAVTTEVMTTLAATFAHQIWWPALRRFSDYVDGSTAPCDDDQPVLRRVQTAWALYARFVPDVYDITVLTNANALKVRVASRPSSLTRLAQSAFAAAPLLFVKAARNSNDDSFWRSGRYQ